jgi:hypothetical protein
MLLRGVFRALVRIGEVRPDLVRFSSEFIKPYFKNKDTLIRAYATILAGRLLLKEYISDIEKLMNDREVIKIYTEGEFKKFTVGHIAEQTVTVLVKK